MVTKFFVAGEEAMAHLAANKAAFERSSFSEAVTAAVSKFKEAYNKQMTTTIVLAGAAMAPILNAKALTDNTDVEKLVVRHIARPSVRNVAVGDVVAFNNPLSIGESSHVMVRRVAALEGQEMVSDAPEDEAFTIPPGHCWVLADNDKVKPTDVIDSRSLGNIPMSNIIGRIIYHFSSKTDHGPVLNSPQATLADSPIVEEEVKLELLEQIGSKP